MKNKLIQACFFLTLLGLLLITPIGKASATTDWDLKITNLSGNTVDYTYSQLLAMPMSNVSASLLCFGNLVTSGLWSGVSLSYLLAQVGVDSSVASVDFKAQDGYTVSIPIQVAMQSNVIIAYEQDGSPLPEELRLVLPEQNGAMWIAFITTISLDTAIIDIDQYQSSGEAEQSRAPKMTTTGSPTIEQQTPLPTATPVNESNIQPTVPASNTTQQDQKTSPPQVSNPTTVGFQVAAVYAVALGVIVASVATSYLAFSRRHR